jgi:hypothetical protein
MKRSEIRKGKKRHVKDVLTRIIFGIFVTLIVTAVIEMFLIVFVFSYQWALYMSDKADKYTSWVIQKQRYIDEGVQQALLYQTFIPIIIIFTFIVAVINYQKSK